MDDSHSLQNWPDVQVVLELTYKPWPEKSRSTARVFNTQLPGNKNIIVILNLISLANNFLKRKHQKY